MTMQEFLGWGQSLVVSLGLMDYIKAGFVIVLGAYLIKTFSGRRGD